MAKKAKPSSKPVTKTRAPKKLVKKNVKGAPFNEQDPKRRLGDFSGAGEHPRQGGRTSGIIGQNDEAESHG